MPNMKWFCFVYLFQIVVNVEAFSTRRNWDYRICFHWFHIYNRQMKSSESIKRKWPWCMLRISYCYSTPSFRGKEHLWDWWMTIFLKRKHKCWSKPLLLTLVYKTALFLYNFQKKSVLLWLFQVKSNTSPRLESLREQFMSCFTKGGNLIDFNSKYLLLRTSR